MELKIKGKISSLGGIAITSGKKGDIVLIKTSGKYLENKDLTDKEILLAKNHIEGLMSNFIFPLFIANFSSKELPKNFSIQSVRVEMFNDKSKNLISFNDDAKIFATMKLKNQHKLEINERIIESDIEKITSLYVKDKDPNSAIILLTFFNGNWRGFYDLIYNRELSQKKYTASCEFTSSAISNFRESRLNAFYNDTWSAYELLIESATYLSHPMDKRMTHKGISKLFMNFCQNRKLPYYEDYILISKIRNEERYGRDSGYNITDIASNHLDSLKNFSDYVKKYLIVHHIIAKDTGGKSISSIQTTIRNKSTHVKIIDDNVTSELLRKSAHYRGTLNYFIRLLLDSVYYRYNISKNNTTIETVTWDTSRKSDLEKINDFFTKEYEDNIDHILNINFEQILKFNSEIMFIQQEIDAEKTPNHEFPQDEHDLILDLIEELSSINDRDHWGIEEYSKYGDNAILCFKNNIDNSKYTIPALKRRIQFFYNDTQKIIMILLKLLRIYDEYNKKFPGIAFKGHYSKL